MPPLVQATMIYWLAAYRSLTTLNGVDMLATIITARKGQS